MQRKKCVKEGITMPKFNLFDDFGKSDDAETSSLATTPKLPRFSPAMLVSEAEMQRNAILDELTIEIKPKSFIERMYVKDMAEIIWEIQRLRNFKNLILRLAMQPALKDVLNQLLGSQELPGCNTYRANNMVLSAGWLTNPKDQIKVERMLAEYNLDGTVIKAEAWRRSSGDLALIERMLTSLERRRDKALANVANYRESLAFQLKQVGQRIIEADEVSTNQSQLS
jgi:hypothetical protein